MNYISESELQEHCNMVLYEVCIKGLGKQLANTMQLCTIWTHKKLLLVEMYMHQIGHRSYRSKRPAMDDNIRYIYF